MLYILAKCFVQIDIMSSFIERKSRKEHLINEIIILLRDKLFNEIDAFETLFLLQRVNVLLSTLIVKR